MACCAKTWFKLYLGGGAEASGSHLSFVKAANRYRNRQILRNVLQPGKEGKKRIINYKRKKKYSEE